MADKRRQHCVPVGRGGGDASAVDPQPLTGGPRGWAAPRGREKGEGVRVNGGAALLARGAELDMRPHLSAAEFFWKKKVLNPP